MNYTFGLIGTGNMGGAVARAVSQVLKNVVSQSLGMLLFMAMLLLLYYFQLL